MTRKETGEGWVVGAVLGGTAMVGGLLLTVAAWPRPPARQPSAQAPDDRHPVPRFTDADVEAAARMLASENARASQALHVELIHTQLRARKPGQSLLDRITAGSGWGPQGESKPGGGVRPVSTEASASPALRALTWDVLQGRHSSALPGARKFFQPEQQDRALEVGKRARQKRANGQPLTKQEKRLLGYRRSAEEVRAEWRADGARHLGTIEGVEFYT